MEASFLWMPTAKVLFAILLGSLIGLERELAQKPAGLRTHMLVCGASALLVVLGDIMIANYSSGPVVKAIQADPIRIMEAIITGISFLGAGTIIFRSQKESVEGLTTAASILFAAAIGITVALQEFILASILTVIVIVILFGLGYIERLIKKLRKKIYGDNTNS
jgi:putative Mg2+ transporter-C (MgtC) family protein